ncbi:MAG: hypothetical protein ACYSUP_18895, partial [Planctomycetota bacterium]
TFEVDVECPRCHFVNPIWMKQARLRDTIICRGCKRNIYLDDSMNSVRKAQRRISEQFKKMKRRVEEINRISW